MKDNVVYIKHLFDAINKIERYLGNVNYDEFLDDDKTQDAIIRQLEIIGEAASKCSNEFKNKYPDIPWRQMQDARNRMIHDYMGVMVEIIWGICKEDLIDLKTKLINYFEADLNQDKN